MRAYMCIYIYMCVCMYVNMNYKYCTVHDVHAVCAFDLPAADHQLGPLPVPPLRGVHDARALGWCLVRGPKDQTIPPTMSILIIYIS